MKRIGFFGFLTIFLLGALSQSVLADAIVRNQSMDSETIAEFYVSSDAVRLELEIGLGDLRKFSGLLPSALLSELGIGFTGSYADRVNAFGETGIQVLADDRLLSPVVEAVAGRERVVRDEVTGQPVEVADGDAETVVHVSLRYPLTSRPDQIQILNRFSGELPTIGFVVYHDGVYVNDFRFLWRSQVLNLDWDDPWYSVFEARALLRKNSSAMSGFIYVEPYEVRKEVVVRPKDIQRWIDLGLAGKDIIPVEQQAAIKQQVAEFLRDKQPVTIDGVAVPGELASANFLRRTLTSSQVIDPPEPLNVNSAVMGLIYVYPVDIALPQDVKMTWDLFDDKVTRVSGSAIDEAGPLPTYLEPDYPVLHWQNFIKNPTLREYADLPAAPSAVLRQLGLYQWLLVVLAATVFIFGVYTLLRKQRSQGAVLIGASAVLMVVWFVTAAGQLKPDEQRELIEGLLKNTYLAFDYRAEGDVYDALDRSVTGDLLTQVYIETRQSLELASQGGARAKVKEIELVDVSPRAQSANGMSFEAQWNVAASVGHWGHIHQRNNGYRAILDVAVEDGVWKLMNIEVLEERRL